MGPASDGAVPARPVGVAQTAACRACRSGRAAAPRRSRWSAGSLNLASRAAQEAEQLRGQRRPGRRRPAAGSTTALTSSPHSSYGYAEHGHSRPRPDAPVQRPSSTSRGYTFTPGPDDHVASGGRSGTATALVEVADVAHAEGVVAPGVRPPSWPGRCGTGTQTVRRLHVDQAGLPVGTAGRRGRAPGPREQGQGRPTVPGWPSHSVAEIHVPPPSVAAYTPR